MSATHTIVARRWTYDGERLQFWSDGAITIGHEANNRLVARDVSPKVLWLIADDASFYDASEVRGLVKAARKALDSHERAPHRTLESDLRRLMRFYAPRAPRGAS